MGTWCSFWNNRGQLIVIIQSKRIDNRSFREFSCCWRFIPSYFIIQCSLSWVIKILSLTSSRFIVLFDSSNNDNYHTSNDQYKLIMIDRTTLWIFCFSAVLPRFSCQSGVYNSSSLTVSGVSSISSNASNHLATPNDLFIDNANHIYVVDSGNSRIQQFPSGLLQKTSVNHERKKIHSYYIGTTSGTAAVTVAGYTTTGGNSNSELDNPTAIFIVSNTDMYIYDSGNFRIQKWIVGQPLGFTVAGDGTSSMSLQSISLGYGLYVDTYMNIYVSEYNNHRVSMWTNGSVTGVLVSVFSFEKAKPNLSFSSYR